MPKVWAGALWEPRRIETDTQRTQSPQRTQRNPADVRPAAIVSSMVPANPYNPPLRRGLMKVRFISVVAGIVAIAAPLAAQNQSGSARRPQAAKADAKPYVAPKTPWGHPDIS